jgi:hypothetical protein
MAVALCSTACKDKAASGPAGTLEQRCETLAKACGDNDKHVEKIVDGCKQAAQPQVDKGCSDKALALYDCYEKQVCGKADKVWAYDDLRVLGERNKLCAAERTALAGCVGK